MTHLRKIQQGVFGAVISQQYDLAQANQLFGMGCESRLKRGQGVLGGKDFVSAEGQDESRKVVEGEVDIDSKVVSG